ncbi:MAG: TniQ family protein [Magnetococcales bacterium]|nr:TniQ family protein [Magnetococcales bacterium]
MASKPSFPWPVRPAILPGEAFSSWFARLAVGNGLRPEELYRVYLPGAYLCGRDLDRFACESLIDFLSQRTATDRNCIEASTFMRWSGLLYGEDDGRGKLHWLPPAGRERTTSSFGQQICPACLAEDEMPYLRLEWRLGFMTACERHCVSLVDRCPNCAEPLYILHAQRNLSGVRCWKCSFDYSHAEQVEVLGLQTFRQQEHLNNVLTEGWGELGDYGHVHALPYFKILSMVFRLLATGRFSLAMRLHIARSGGYPPPSGIPRIKEVENLNPRCRRELLRMACGLMEDWPHRFLDTCRSIGLAPRHLIRDPVATPFAFWDAVRGNLAEPIRVMGAEEMASACWVTQKRGKRKTRVELLELVRVKTKQIDLHADPSIQHLPYGDGRYWKLDGVSPEIRRAAKLAASREGENVGAWVDKALRKATGYLMAK